MIIVSHAVLTVALIVQEPMHGVATTVDRQSRLDQIARSAFQRSGSRPRRRSTDFTAAGTATRQPSVHNPRNLKRWLPWIGAAVGGTLLGAGVADEEDLVPSGKVMWVGIGAAAGAGVGWVIARISNP